jgi:hypothetical protein
MHRFRWDLDKTYLHTEFGSVRAMVRTALEPAASKRNTPGSAALLRALQLHDPGSETTVVSGSPTQMRRVLEEKLTQDGIKVDHFTLKDNLGNLRRGRFRAVWGQVGYKLPELLKQRTRAAPDDTETLFGDDAEVDAAVYMVYADAISGRIPPARLREVLERGGAYPDDIGRALRALSRAPQADAVEDIFIRIDAGGPLARFEPLGTRITPIFSWMQAALVLWRRRRLGVEGFEAVARSCIDEADLGPESVAGLFQDAVRRGLVPPDAVHELLQRAAGLEPVRDVVNAALRRMGPPPARRPDDNPPDPLAFLDAADRGTPS